MSDKILSKSYQIECGGIDSDGDFLLEKGDERATVIIKLYTDGSSDVLCRYLKSGRCNVFSIISKKEESKDAEFNCFYISK